MKHSLKVETMDDTVKVGRLYVAAEDSNPNIVSSKSSFVVTDTALLQLETLAAAVNSNCPVLLEGPTHSGKSSVVRELARLVGKPLVEIYMHSDMEAADLVGQWTQVIIVWIWRLARD